MNIDLMDEMDAVEVAYGALAHAVRAAGIAANSLAGAKSDLDCERALALAEGIEAKNEAMREAALRVRFADDYENLSFLERQARETRLSAELAQLEVDRVRLRVRLMELAAGQERQTA